MKLKGGSDHIVCIGFEFNGLGEVCKSDSIVIVFSTQSIFEMGMEPNMLETFVCLLKKQQKIERKMIDKYPTYGSLMYL